MIRIEECIPGILHLPKEIAGVVGGPVPSCIVQGQVQGVFADNTDRCHGRLDGACAAMAVHEYQIGGYLIPKLALNHRSKRHRYLRTSHRSRYLLTVCLMFHRKPR